MWGTDHNRLDGQPGPEDAVRCYRFLSRNTGLIFLKGTSQDLYSDNAFKLQGRTLPGSLVGLYLLH